MPLSSAPPTFRSASKADYLDSHLRRNILNSFATREVQPSKILGLDLEPNLLEEGEEKWILRDEASRLAEWQYPDVLEHWAGAWLVVLDWVSHKLDAWLKCSHERGVA